MARVDLGWRNGHRVQKALYGRTQAEVIEKLGKALQQVRQGLPIPGERQSVGEFLTYWLEEVARPRVRRRTYDTYEQTIRLHIHPYLAKVRLAKLTP